MNNLNILGGSVIDPRTGLIEKRDLFIRNGVFASTPAPESGVLTFNAVGCYVAPGFIDAHTHLYEAVSGMGGHADVVCPPSGVTTAIDAGSSGIHSVGGFYRDRMHSATSIKAAVGACPTGVMVPPHEEIQDPVYCTPEIMLPLFERYGDFLVGIKQRVHHEVTGAFGLAGLRQARDTARLLRERGHRCRIMVHFGPLAEEIALADVLDCLDAGDVITHIYRPAKGSTIFDGDGRVLECARQARERGVVFESGCARSHLSFESVRKAFDEGFPPQIISTDLVNYTFFNPPSGWLALKMAIYLNHGMPLGELVKAVTLTPATTYGLLDEAGTLDVGKPGDVAIFRVEDHPFRLDDLYGGSMQVRELIVPMATVKAGAPVFRQVYFGH